jgi:hypothetical protein
MALLSRLIAGRNSGPIVRVEVPARSMNGRPRWRLPVPHQGQIDLPEAEVGYLREAGPGVVEQPDDRPIAQLDEVLALARVQDLLRVLVRMIEISRVGVLGCRTRSIGDWSISSSSTVSHLKNCCSALCLFNAVDADRVSTIQAWNASICGRVTAVGQRTIDLGDCHGERRPRSFIRSQILNNAGCDDATLTRH